MQLGNRSETTTVRYSMSVAFQHTDVPHSRLDSTNTFLILSCTQGCYLSTITASEGSTSALAPPPEYDTTSIRAPLAPVLGRLPAHVRQPSKAEIWSRRRISCERRSRKPSGFSLFEISNFLRCFVPLASSALPRSTTEALSCALQSPAENFLSPEQKLDLLKSPWQWMCDLGSRTLQSS